LNPATLYGVSKNSLRTLLAAYCAREGISHAWGRMFLMYGPNESPQRLVPAVIRACLEGKAPQCSHGRQIRDFLHVRDVAEAFAALLESPIEGAVNIGSGDSISLRDLVTKIVELCGGSPANFGVVPAAPNDPPVLVPRVERLRNEVGWKASIGLENGLLETIEALKKRGTAI
jgi:nucleoside-diphosphate-sugar epimerase